MKTNRSICIVPGCCNSSAKFYPYPYICGPHWRGVSKTTKAEHRATHRAEDWPAFRANWDQCEVEAIERAAGL